jgi:hypothetical protein
LPGIEVKWEVVAAQVLVLYKSESNFQRGQTMILSNNGVINSDTDYRCWGLKPSGI